MRNKTLLRKLVFGPICICNRPSKEGVFFTQVSKRCFRLFMSLVNVSLKKYVLHIFYKCFLTNYLELLFLVQFSFLLGSRRNVELIWSVQSFPTTGLNIYSVGQMTWFKITLDLARFLAEMSACIIICVDLLQFCEWLWSWTQNTLH